MIGLPGEGDGELCDTVRTVNASGSWGIKIHSVYVAKGTELERMLRDGDYFPIDMDTYVRRAAYAISNVRPDMVVHRITGDCPHDILVAPEWNKEKNKVIEKIRKSLELAGLYQGSKYRE